MGKLKKSQRYFRSWIIARYLYIHMYVCIYVCGCVYSISRNMCIIYKLIKLSIIFLCK